MRPFGAAMRPYATRVAVVAAMVSTLDAWCSQSSRVAPRIRPVWSGVLMTAGRSRLVRLRAPETFRNGDPRRRFNWLRSPAPHWATSGGNHPAKPAVQ
jgi:hypothetical protein